MFDLKFGNIIPDPNKLMIPAFSRIWERDKDKTKSVAMKELAFIYYMADFKSPYSSIPEDDRAAHIINDIMPLSWKIDIHILAAIEQYKKLSRTPSMDLLESAQEALKTLGERLRDKATSTKDLNTTLKQLKESLISYDALKDQVEKELLNSESRTKGQVKIRDRERVK